MLDAVHPAYRNLRHFEVSFTSSGTRDSILILTSLMLALTVVGASAATNEEASFQDNALLSNPATLPETM